MRFLPPLIVQTRDMRRSLLGCERHSYLSWIFFRWHGKPERDNTERRGL